MSTGEQTMFHDDHTIASFAEPVALREMCIEGRTQDRGAALDLQVFHIRMANSRGTREAASLLIRKMYGWRGYEVAGAPEHGPNQITLYAETGGATVGTMSLCLDGDAGLPADDNFGDILGGLRGAGRRLCEPARLAIDAGVSKRVFAALIHISYIYAHNIHGYSDYVIEVNPRHVMFYKRMLGFRDCAAERLCARVNAPAVLLRLELEQMGRMIRRHGGHMERHGKERSFYPYFFPPEDEPGMTARLLAGRD
jgi:hypothetical protein